MPARAGVRTSHYSQETRPTLPGWFLKRTGKVPLKLDAGQDDAIAGAWEKRAATLESFYDKSKAW